MSAETAVRERFKADTCEHLMSVLRDDGLYRHLRFRRPETIMYGFDLVTWPGYLAIVGDIQDHLFARTPDMFEFFAAGPGINPGYWSEKIHSAGDRESVRVYSQEAYRRNVGQWLAQQPEGCSSRTHQEFAALRTAVQEQLLDGVPYNAHDAMSLLHRFEHDGRTIDAPYEWDLCEWDGNYLWCCWAIKWGIAQYREAKTATGS